MPSIDNSLLVNNNLILTDQSSTPTTPPSGKSRIFTKADGLYVVDDAGAVTGPLAVAGAAFDAAGWSAADAMTYASADAPTFTMTCTGNQTTKYAVGMRVKLTQTTVKYFIVTAVAYTSSTAITMYGGTDYTLSDAAIVSPSYSAAKAPLGFPMDPAKWTVSVADTSERAQASPTNSQWYNLGSLSISIPIGAWDVSYNLATTTRRTANGLVTIYTTLSTANNSESDKALSTFSAAANTTVMVTQVHRKKQLTVTSKTAYYLNASTDATNTSLEFRGSIATTVIMAVCAYL